MAVEASELRVTITKLSPPTLIERLKVLPSDALIALISPAAQYLATKPGLRDWIRFTTEQRSSSCGCEITDVPTASKWNTKQA